jgi:hypothetical protein
MSRGVLAMRLRLALLRKKISVEVDRLIADRAYAQDVLAMCKSMDQVDLISLAERLVLSEDDGPSAAAPASPAERGASSRFHQGSGSAADSAAGTASRPMSTVAPATGGGTTGFDDPASLDPNDPDSPRNRRYLRGAR